MSEQQPTPETSPAASTSAASPGFRADTLAQGVMLMVLLAGGQRLVGFARGILFCRWLPADELGLWDLVLGFLLLAAPLTVLGIPGSLGRYVEKYRQSGQLRTLLKRMTGVSILLALIGAGLLLMCRQWVSWFIFDDPGMANLVTISLAALVSVIAYNFLIELFTSLRQTRVVSVMELCTSLLFAGLGLTLLNYRTDASMVILAFGGSAAIVSLGALIVLWRLWSRLPVDTQPLAAGNMWGKLLPFAAWVWMTNMLTNLFCIADRYMIMHFSGEDLTAAAVMVGNYHSSRVVPMLAVSLATLLAAMTLPHLSEDWERGRRTEAGRRQNLIVKSFALAAFAGGVVLLLGAPLLFGVLLDGKYDGGLSVLPWTTAYCVWFGLSMLAQNYLWCAERGKLVSLLCFLGLAANIALNLVLLPYLGLLGAVMATAAGNVVALVLTFWWSHRHGLPRDVSVWLACALPLTLPLGPLPALCVLLLVALLSLKSQLIFSNRQKAAVRREVRERLAGPLNRFARRRNNKTQLTNHKQIPIAKAQ